MMRVGVAAFLLLGFALLPAGAPSPAPDAVVGEMVPIVLVLRERVKHDLKLSETLYERDVVETARKARARLRLVEGSVINLGPRTRFTFLTVSETTQQAGLELHFGRVRAEVSRRTRRGGRFEINTRTAVLGVIGTTVFAAAFPDETPVAILSADPTAVVSVRSSNPAIDGEVLLKPGYGTRVALDRAPAPPRLWGREEIGLANDDTREFPR
jgi:hypothetical protein